MVTVLTSDSSVELHRWFGHPGFRPGQEAIVDAVLAGHDVLAVMPTGAGKSIGYQLPALMLPGLTLVVSPLISLMKDQVDELNRKDISAAAIHSQLSYDQVGNVMIAARGGVLRMLYVAPERFASPRFVRLLEGLPIARFAVDEAHCVSEWGHDFRPDYRRLVEAAGRCSRSDGRPGRPPVIGFTATATPEVRADIVDLLGLLDPRVFVTGFDRPNLSLDVRKVSGAIEKHELLPGLIGGRRSLVYGSTRKSAEKSAETLQAAGVAARAYHAGLPDAERSEVQDGFASGQIRVVCATNAFGMGIDRPDIEVIVHVEIPGSLEAYYQEIGRAGRDGRSADVTLLWNYVDVRTREYFIDRPDSLEPPERYDPTRPTDKTDPAERDRKRDLDRAKLRRMIAYADSTGCYRATLLGYFGETDAPVRCDACGNCRRRTVLNAEQLTLLQKVLSGVARAGERWGRRKIAAMLRGDVDGLPPSLTDLSTTGLLRDESDRHVSDWLEAAVGAGLLRLSDDKYRLLSLTPTGRDVLTGTAADVAVTLPERSAERRRPAKTRATRRTRSGRATTPATPSIALDVDDELLADLKQWRRQTAIARGVPPYVVLHDKTLLELASLKPATLEALAEVSGIGPTKLSTYGPSLIRMVTGEQDDSEP